MEIERKFFLSGFPKNYPPMNTYSVKQGYLSIEPEVRIRESILLSGSKKMSPYKMTVKGNGSICREEIETEISKEFYTQLSDFISKSFIEKDFKTYSFDGYKIEISMVDNHWFYGEVEFKTLEDAHKFEWPWKDILIREVTDDPSYKMKNYWVSSRDIKI